MFGVSNFLHKKRGFCGRKLGYTGTYRAVPWYLQKRKL